MRKVIVLITLKNNLSRPQIFTLTNGTSFRLSSKLVEGYSKEIENDLISLEISKAIKEGKLYTEEVKRGKRLNKKI